MKQPSTPPSKTPNLLAPVIKALEPMNTAQRTEVGKKAGASLSTVNVLMRDTGARGPSYRTVCALYELLIVKGWRPKA